ncbi:chit-2c [Spodoptera frugiperda granulovirus]|uniref:Chit-2c n=1 Tax=Spodoptera frugiperda granulovirus TaxID=307454 RepID=A0A0C5B3A7_9BBAC|nr:chit-2c [Spodoptera frugiperda granulovirus]AJK91795.1 chit-2c [Spodoptera frugiperda granulovirus]
MNGVWWIVWIVVIVVIVIIVFINSNSNKIVDETIPIECPPGFIGNIADPNNCRQFYTCSVNGILGPSKCGGTSYFNTSNQSCVAGNSDICGDRPVVDEVGFTCPSNSPLNIPNPQNCSQFYLCSGTHVSGPLACSLDYAFDEQINNCQPKETVDCGDRPKMY